MNPAVTRYLLTGMLASGKELRRRHGPDHSISDAIQSPELLIPFAVRLATLLVIAGPETAIHSFGMAIEQLKSIARRNQEK